MKDIHSSLLAALAFGPVAASADTTSGAIDLIGYNAAEILLGVGIGGVTFDASNKIEFVVTHSDDDSTYTSVTADDLLGVASVTDGIVKALTAEHAVAGVYRAGYIGGKRYLKIEADFSGTHGSPTPLFCFVNKGYGFDNPQADQI